MIIEKCKWSYIIHPDEQIQIINITENYDFWIDLDNYDYSYDSNIESFIYDVIVKFLEEKKHDIFLI